MYRTIKLFQFVVTTVGE